MPGESCTATCQRPWLKCLKSERLRKLLPPNSQVRDDGQEAKIGQSDDHGIGTGHENETSEFGCAGIHSDAADLCECAQFRPSMGACSLSIIAFGRCHCDPVW